MPTKRIQFVLGVILIALMSCDSMSEPGQTMSSFNLPPGSQREAAYTDKGDAHWVTVAGDYHNSPWHGLTIAKRGYFEDLFISSNGHLLPRDSADVTMTPVSLVRSYSALGIKETWTLLDKKRTLIIELEAEDETIWMVQPAILGGNQAQDFELLSSDYELNIVLNRYVNLPTSYPYLKLQFSEPVHWQEAQTPEVSLFTAWLTPQAITPSSRKLVITVSLNSASHQEQRESDWIAKGKEARQARMLALGAATRLTSNLPDVNKAIYWAHQSLNTLVMEQLGKGIYAGLPWFDDYWGRDAFISYAGAVLVSGQFEDAQQILLAFADLQNTDESDRNYGRMPNRAQPENIIYNTTDGTPWFVRSVWDYYRYTGDADFLRSMWPAIKRATEGALMNWVDADGLLRHDDADTWMDAKGPDGPWSPRGDRAIDIQFIWRDQLEITLRLAQKYDEHLFAQEVEATLQAFYFSLEKFRAPESKVLVDHLNIDGLQDDQLRPNVFLVPPLFQETCDPNTFAALGPKLITRKGVLSLSQNDPNFHPFHQLPGRYVKDAAYHNGIIWTWNSAAAITPAIGFHQFHYAEALFKDLTDQILSRGALGSIAELTDAWPRNGEFKLSGTFSQAWSLAEYLRSFYQNILGVQPDLSRSQVTLAPRLIAGLRDVSFIHPLGDDEWNIEYAETQNHFDFIIQRTNAKPIDMSIEVFTGQGISHLNVNWAKTSLRLRYEKHMGQWTLPSEIEDYTIITKNSPLPPNSLDFCEVDTTIAVPVLKGPEHRLLSEADIHTFNPQANLLLEVQDSPHDDHGYTGQFSYPSNPQFENGLADILSLEVKEGPDHYEFRLEFANLVDPGWHPEYGYQLTYCALGISYADKNGTAKVGKHARAEFQKNFLADQIVYISGGILIVDADFAPVAEYMPSKPSGAIGDASTETLHFSLPRDVFKSPLADARFQLAVGCQDDHGGAGIGDFRSVKEVGGEWNGGGGSNLGSNVYDWLIL